VCCLARPWRAVAGPTRGGALRPRMLRDVHSLCVRHVHAERPRHGFARQCHACSAAQAAGPPQTAAARLDDLFGSGPLLTLERSAGPRADRDAALWASGAFGGGVYPDLPAATTWPALLRQLAQPWCGPRTGGGPCLRAPRRAAHA